MAKKEFLRAKLEARMPGLTSTYYRLLTLNGDTLRVIKRDRTTYDFKFTDDHHWSLMCNKKGTPTPKDVGLNAKVSAP